jgi:hypothetical protein
MRRGSTDRGRPAVHELVREMALVAIGCGLLVLAIGCGSNAGESDDGSLQPAESGMALSERENALQMGNHSMQCSFCSCHPLVPPSLRCEAALLDSFPPAKQMVICEIAAGEHMEACLSLAQSCDDAQKCEAAQEDETAKCPKFDPLALPLPPSGC